MKLFKTLTIIGFACLFAIACSDSPTTTGQVKKTETQASSQVASSAPAGSAEIAGMLMQTEKGLAIVTGTDTYVLAGKDLSDRIGQTVKVTGTLAEIDGDQVIDVMSVTPME